MVVYRTVFLIKFFSRDDSDLLWWAGLAVRKMVSFLVSMAMLVGFVCKLMVVTGVWPVNDEYS